MTKEFVTYETALVLKELGFNEKCMAKYNSWSTLFIREEPEPSEKEVPAPLYQQAFRWFREEHGLNSYIYQRSNITYRGVIHKNMKIAVNYTSDSSNYEEAESACLDKLIEIIKNK